MTVQGNEEEETFSERFDRAIKRAIDNHNYDLNDRMMEKFDDQDIVEIIDGLAIEFTIEFSEDFLDTLERCNISLAELKDETQKLAAAASQPERGMPMRTLNGKSPNL